MAPDDKEQARGERDRGAAAPTTGAARTVSVRINGLDTHWCYRDVVDVVEARGDVLDTLLVPEGGRALRRGVRGDAAGPDRAAQRLGAGAHRHPHPDRDGGRDGQRRGDQPRAARPARGDGVRRGRLRGQRPCAHHEHRRREPRLRGAHRPRRRSGARARSTGATSGTSGSAAWWRRAAPRGCVRSTARSATSTTPTAIAAPRHRAAALGCEGKWAIHPSQVALANEVFSPIGRRGRPRPAHPAGHGGRGEGGQGGGLARRTADRRRVHPHGRESDPPGRSS